MQKSHSFQWSSEWGPSDCNLIRFVAPMDPGFRTAANAFGVLVQLNAMGQQSRAPNPFLYTLYKGSL